MTGMSGMMTTAAAAREDGPSDISPTGWAQTSLAEDGLPARGSCSAFFGTSDVCSLASAEELVSAAAHATDIKSREAGVDSDSRNNIGSRSTFLDINKGFSAVGLHAGLKADKTVSTAGLKAGISASQQEEDEQEEYAQGKHCKCRIKSSVIALDFSTAHLRNRARRRDAREGRWSATSV